MRFCGGRRTLLAEIQQSHRAEREADSVTWQLQSLLWKKENSCFSHAFPLDPECLFLSDDSVVKCTIAKNRCKMYTAHSPRPRTREVLFQLAVRRRAQLQPKPSRYVTPFLQGFCTARCCRFCCVKQVCAQIFCYHSFRLFGIKVLYRKRMHFQSCSVLFSSSNVKTG